jgi:membrane associated rhomboid family serine protease
VKKTEWWKTIRWPLLFVTLIWLIEGFCEMTGTRPMYLSIKPRSADGLAGIITSPFLHSGIDHLYSNTIPLLVVGTGIIFFYRQISVRVITMIWLFTGFWVWLFARPYSHIGASGLIYGFVSFLFFSGIIRRDTRLLAISLLVTFLYGSMVWGILPVDQSISFESHLFGAAAGIFAAFYYRKEGPEKPKTLWELEEEEERRREELGLPPLSEDEPDPGS